MSDDKIAKDLYSVLQCSGVTNTVRMIAVLISWTRQRHTYAAVRGHLMRIEQELEICAVKIHDHEQAAMKADKQNGKAASPQHEDEPAKDKPADPWGFHKVGW